MEHLTIFEKAYAVLISKNIVDAKKANPYEESTPEFRMFSHGYTQYVQFHQGIKKL